MNLTFNQTLLPLILLAALTAPATASPHDHDDHQEHPTEESHDDHEEGELELEDTAIDKAEITLEKVAPAELTITATLFGKTEPDPQRLSHVKARYAGLIMSVMPSLGDTVKQGQALVVVEANDSLKRYTIKAPIGGTVVDLHANKGEFAGESALMTIADFGKLWAVLSVFPQDADRVKNGQSVTLSAGPRSAQSTIRFLNPGSDSQPTVMAHVPLDNSDGRWTPGLLVQANVVTDTFTVPLAVRNDAIHQVNGETVVFVRNEHGFEVVDVSIGRRDAHFSEVTVGLHAGDRYAVGNSYLLKAELEKSSASHDH
ncbi:MAG: efflux RND transporter periplasmic adaptor subunit [Gammaproteobacteria bacterium]|nr:efflux RND transporter periplasmic adaptor subunit [Gammaproteobacteria bacterium]